MKKKIFSFLFFCCIFVQLHGQLYKVPLDEKIHHATLIIEGMVLERKSYPATNGDIFTANKIKVNSLLKGSYSEKYLTLITRGGEVDGETQTWTHLLTLNKGEQGVFFLDAVQDTHFQDAFEAYSSMQGFLKFTKNRFNAWVASDPFNFYPKIDTDIFEYIAQRVGKSATVIDKNQTILNSGIRYHIRDIDFDGVSVKFNIYVNSLMGTKQLYKSDIRFDYNSFFGSNIATNGFVLQDAGISLSNSYDLAQSDLTSQKAKMEVFSVGNVSQLTAITTDEQLLVKGEIMVQNIAMIPQLTYDAAGMQLMSKYYENGMEQPFDMVIVEGDWNLFAPECVPNITSFSPTVVNAGTFDTLTIKGICFGATRDTSKVEFQNSATGFSIPDDWVQPLDSNYVFWSDTLIRVIVPSFVKSANLQHSAGTGKIKLTCRAGTFTTSTNLTIRFAVLNAVTAIFFTPPNKPIPIVARNFNGLGGVSLYYSKSFKADTNAVKAFERGLKRWRCSTLINYIVQDSASIRDFATAAKIEFSSLPVGTTTTLATTSNSPIQPCPDTPVLAFVRRKFSIQFNSMLSWHTAMAMPVPLPANTYDLESRATHELGHAHLLNHSNNIADLMYWTDSTAPYEYRRDIMPNDLAGGLHVSRQSSTLVSRVASCQPPMQLTPIGNCNNLSHSDEIDYSSYLIVQPNPVTDLLQFQFDGSIHSMQTGKVLIVNAIGQPLLIKPLANELQSIDVSSLPTGYFNLILVQDGIPIARKPFIKI